MTATLGGAVTTDPAAIEGVRGGARPPPPRSVEAEGRRQEAQRAPSMVWSEPAMAGSELFRDDRRGKAQTHDSTHLSNELRA